jgi:hypothetical protein
VSRNHCCPPKHRITLGSDHRRIEGQHQGDCRARARSAARPCSGHSKRPRFIEIGSHRCRRVADCSRDWRRHDDGRIRYGSGCHSGRCPFGPVCHLANIRRAPPTVPAPVGPAQAVAPATNIAPALSPVAPPMPAQPAPPLKAPGQCEIGQVQQLALNLSATERSEVGNVIRIHSGSYVSPPTVLTQSSQTVTFPAPPGSTDSARIIIEQKNTGGSTFDDDANGITTEVERRIDPHRDLLLLRWTTPRC